MNVSFKSAPILKPTENRNGSSYKNSLKIYTKQTTNFLKKEKVKNGLLVAFSIIATVLACINACKSYQENKENNIKNTEMVIGIGAAPNSFAGKIFNKLNSK
jgi:hypothetical protein